MADIKKAKSSKSLAIDPEESLVRICATGALHKKAENVVILDMRGISSFTDFFLIASASSEPQIKAIVNSILEDVRDATGERPIAQDGTFSSQWVIIDYNHVVVHILHTQKRAIYELENLWDKARRLELHNESAI